jgi:uncharacterized protein (TIGR02246 family)
LLLISISIVMAMGAAAALPAQAAGQSADSAGRAVAEAWLKAWNTHDVDALADVVDERVDFITVGGRWLKGREAFKEHHTRLHTTVSRGGSTDELRETHAQQLSPDVLLVHVEWSTKGDRDPDGTAREPHDTIMTWVLTASGGRWRIRASQNVNVTESLRFGTGIATTAVMPAPTPDQSADTSGRRAAEAWQKAWNTHDMNALADVVDERVDFVTLNGRWLKGREVFKQHHTQLHTTLAREATVAIRGTHAQRLSPDILLVHVEWSMKGDRDPDGTARKPLDGISTWVLTQSGGRWRIRAAHTTYITLSIQK